MTITMTAPDRADPAITTRRFGVIGITEFVIELPPRARWRELEQLAATLPNLRAFA